MDLTTHQTHEFTGDTVICNIDPAAKMIGEEQFSQTVRRKLSYGILRQTIWSIASSKTLICEDYGFGKWNLSFRASGI